MPLSRGFTGRRVSNLKGTRWVGPFPSHAGHYVECVHRPDARDQQPHCGSRDMSWLSNDDVGMIVSTLKSSGMKGGTSMYKYRTGAVDYADYTASNSTMEVAAPTLFIGGDYDAVRFFLVSQGVPDFSRHPSLHRPRICATLRLWKTRVIGSSKRSQTRRTPLCLRFCNHCKTGGRRSWSDGAVRED